MQNTQSLEVRTSIRKRKSRGVSHFVFQKRMKRLTAHVLHGSNKAQWLSNSLVKNVSQVQFLLSQNAKSPLAMSESDLIPVS